MTALTLQSTNLAAGTALKLETSSLRGGVLAVQAVAAPQRYLPLTSARTDTGVALAIAASNGAMGITRSAGTSLALVGETTSASAVTDKAIWEFDLPDTYNAGAAIPIDINASIAGTGTITAASCTMGLAAYSEVNGVETALTVTGGTQRITAAGADLTWSILGTGLVPGSHVALEATMLITTASGANTGHVNSVSFSA